MTWIALRGWPARMREKAQRIPETYCGSGSGSSRTRAVTRAAMPSRNASETGTWPTISSVEDYFCERLPEEHRTEYL